MLVANARIFWKDATDMVSRRLARRMIVAVLLLGAFYRFSVSGASIEHIALEIEDPASMVKWWTENLGFKVTFSHPEGSTFIEDEAGRVAFELYRPEEGRKAPDYRNMPISKLHFGMFSCDVDADVKRLVAAGAIVEARDEVPGLKGVTLRDPNGIVFQVMKRERPVVSDGPRMAWMTELSVATCGGECAVRNLVHVYENPYPQLHSRQPIFPNLCELPDGTLLCCYIIAEAIEAVDARSYISESRDGGKTWSRPWRMFKDGDLPETEYFKCTSLGGNRVVAIGYGAVRADPDKPQANPETGGLLPHRVYWALSEDGGKTWSGKCLIDESWHGHTEASAPLVALKDGAWAAPIAGFPDWSGKMTSRLCGRMLVTRDGGITWNDGTICMDFGDADVSCYEQRFCVLDSGTIVNIGWNENLKTGRRLPNHITYSTDGGKTFSKPIETGVMGQASSLCALGGERFLAVVARRRDTDEPGVYGYVCDFGDRRWNVQAHGMLWSAGTGPVRRNDKVAEVFGFLKFGQPSVLRLKDGRLMLCFWYQKDGQFQVAVGEVDLRMLKHAVPSVSKPDAKKMTTAFVSRTCTKYITPTADTFEKLKREAVNRERLIIWDDDGCDMTHYPYGRTDLAKQPASVRNFELVFLEATENTRADVIGYSGTMGFGYFTALRTGGDVNTNRFAEANEPWRNAVNEFATMGKDTMDMATDFARRNGKEIFLSLRFNDNHDNAHPAIMLSPFKKNNPEVMVGHGHIIKCCGKNAADFAQDKVRAFVRKYVRCYMENYDLDGIEFDFFRHPQLFRTVAKGEHATESELATMTQLMKDFRAMSEEIGRKRRRPFVLCARVPDSFDYCRAIGIDLDAWLRDGVLDFLVVGGYFQLEPWRKTADRVHGYGVKCYASLDETRINLKVKWQKGKMLPGRNDKECWLGRIAAAMASGMDGVNLFNIEYFKHDDQRYIMQHDIRNLDGIDKTYFATYVGGGGYLPESFLVGGKGFWKTTGLNPAYPVKLAKGKKHTFDLVFGDNLAAAKKKGKQAKIEISVLTDLKGTASPAVKVRGKTLAGGTQKDGMTTFYVDDSCFAKGENAVEIVAPEDMTLHDFSVRVTFQ